MSKKECDISQFVGKKMDPYSKSGKDRISKTNCAISSIVTDEGTTFFLGDNFSKEVMLAKAYFGTQKQFDETKNSWNTTFGEVKRLDSQRILITDGSGPKQSGLLLSPEKGTLISRALDKIKMMNDL